MKNQLIEYLKFDSQFFKLNISKLKKNFLKKNHLTSIRKFCKKENIHLLQFKCDSSNSESIDNAEKLGFKFVDTRIILKKTINNKYTIKKNNTRLRLAKKSDIIKLKSFANNMFVESRYYYDKQFPKIKLNEFYNDWIRKGILSEFDDYVLLLTEESKIIGICTIKSTKDIATIGLFGIKKSYRKKNYGSIFLKKINNKLFDNKIKIINVITQGRNYSAISLYQKHYFLIEKIEIYYHKWFS